MTEYPKIHTMFKRDEQTKQIIYEDWSLEEFNYLKTNPWVFTEKVDGTNIRVMWQPQLEPSIKFGGKTDSASIPVFLYDKLNQIFTYDKMKQLGTDEDHAMCLYGEGYGAKIQKGGGNYNPKGVDFVLFDVKIGEWWLRRKDIESIAAQLGIDVVPIVGEGTLYDGIAMVKTGFKSTWGEFQAEGIVAKPKVELKARSGERIITKIKTKDFANVV